MGQRANLIIVEDGEHILRYDHWVANRLDEILFWGVGYALQYFDAQEKVAENGWLDEIWAEGGAVLDLDKKYLLWWGGEDILYELPLRRIYLKLQSKIWEGWTIEWAHRGIVDLAEYVGYPKEKVLSEREDLSSAKELKIAEKKSWLHTIGSIKKANSEIKLFPLNLYTEDYLRNGVDLVKQCHQEKGFDNLVWTDWEENGDFPQGGFLIDEKNKTVEFWQARDCPNVVQELKKLWETWDVVWHQDNYEFQIEALNGKIILPDFVEAELIGKLRERLLREDRKSGIDLALGTNETLKNEGMSVQMSSWTLKSHHIEKPLESKTKIWQKYFGETNK
jgi:hypothetical protein